MTLAVANGMVYAGRNHPPKGFTLAESARMERVHHSTITALVRRGYLKACLSPEGGYAGKITAPANPRQPPAKQAEPNQTRKQP